MIKTLTFLFLALLLTSCSSSDNKDTNSTIVKTADKIEKSATTEITSQKIAPKTQEVKKNILTIETLDGKEIHVNEVTGGLTFEEYKGKAVFVILFGYRCPPCLQEMPNLIALTEKKYPDLEILAIEVQGLNSDDLKEFKKRKGINYRLAVGSQNNQFINYIASRAQWQGSIPFFIAFNKKGEVKIIHVGALNSRQLDSVYSEID